MFKGENIYLFYTYNISLSEAFMSKSIQIISLDSIVLNIFVDETVSPNSVKQVND